MKRFLGVLIGLIFSVLLVSAYTIESGVSINNVPKTLFGSWQVEANLVKTNNLRTFKPTSVDLWNLSRVGNVLRLENPFTGAKAECDLKATEGNLVVFSKTADWDNRVLKDVVSIRINNDTFSGINEVTLEIHSLYDGHALKKETALYEIKGKRLAGNSLVK